MSRASGQLKGRARSQQYPSLPSCLQGPPSRETGHTFKSNQMQSMQWLALGCDRWASHADKGHSNARSNLIQLLDDMRGCLRYDVTCLSPHHCLMVKTDNPPDFKIHMSACSSHHLSYDYLCWRQRWRPRDDRLASEAPYEAPWSEVAAAGETRGTAVIFPADIRGPSWRGWLAPG